MRKELALIIDKIPKAKRPGGAKYIRYKVKKGRYTVSSFQKIQKFGECHNGS